MGLAERGEQPCLGFDPPQLRSLPRARYIASSFSNRPKAASVGFLHSVTASSVSCRTSSSDLIPMLVLLKLTPISSPWTHTLLQ
jgi:hypothetical protein